MAATKSEISQWLKEMRKIGATHMVVKCDTFDWEDYPIFVMPDEDVREIANKKGDQLMEVYSANYTDDEQLSERRAVHFD